MTRILIVDDKEENLAYLRALLSREDCTVDDAHNGAEALAKARLAPPHIIVSDLLMPVMDGYTLLRHWKRDGRLKRVPFIIYTATYTDPEDERLALSLGADAFLLKPAQPEHLLTRIGEVMANAAAPSPVLPRTPMEDENDQLKLYSEVLVRKLELKTILLEESNRALRREAAERQEAQESLRLLGTAVEQARESILITDAQLDLPGPRIVFVNPAFTSMTGYTAEEALGKTPRILQGPRTDRAVLSRLRKNLEEGEGFAGETINYRKDGSEFDIEWQIVPVRNGGGESTHFLSVQRDITVRKEKERELARIHRALKLLSAGNEVLIRTQNEQALRDQICRIVVEMGGYRMAWVGFVQDDAPWSIVPASHAGVEEGYLSEIKVSWNEHDSLGQGPAGRAIRTGQAVVCADFAGDPGCEPWNALAARRGYRGVICLPLRENAHPFGLLALYSEKVETTSASELALLQELADNLAYGILNLRARSERQRLRSAVAKVAAGSFRGQPGRNSSRNWR